ncbi:MAG: polyprenyl synthetase family protein [Candidatus Diapherotrites archaeon]
MVSFDEYLGMIVKAVDVEIERFFPRSLSSSWVSSNLGELEFDLDVKALNSAISVPVYDFLDRGGKRWRAALCVLFCEAFGGKFGDCVRFAVIPELVHNGTIMVDDVEDNSVLRRGKPASHLVFGVDVAVNAANALYYLPLVVLFNSDLSSSKKSAIYDSYSKHLLRLSFGQALDIAWHKSDKVPSEREYLQMCVYKTGSLAAFAAELGAIVAGAPKRHFSVVSSFASSLGVAFQIYDDVLNIAPKSGVWGKEVGDDIKEGKKTLLVIHALKNLPKGDAEKLLSILSLGSKSDDDVKVAIRLIESAGSIDYALAKANHILSSSWLELDKVLRPSVAKSLLRDFADFMVKRKL